jgi:hypothetical protein
MDNNITIILNDIQTIISRRLIINKIIDQITTQEIHDDDDFIIVAIPKKELVTTS